MSAAKDVLQAKVNLDLLFTYVLVELTATVQMSSI